ncbi:MAG: A/G-specific adenine glycosylase [Phycisphaerales bacterium]|nr:A/G-specific adenine glycosylase [Phycisphaerales bacterium]
MHNDRAITDALESWFSTNARGLPWRAEPRDPYHALVSELMLQQTQVSRVLEKFGPFIERFPTVHDLASASEDEVLAMWSGLGYYRRARMLHQCAQAIVEHHDGIVPSDLDKLRSLPGIGRYTAGSIASIVFGQHAPIVDGNVTRVLQRLHNNPSPQTDKDTIAWSWRRATELAECAHDPGTFNEGMMELGATVCTPKNIRCTRCPLREHCAAFEAGTTEQVPPPKPRAKQKTNHCLSVIVTDDRGHLLVEQRPGEGMWAGLFQVPTFEDEAAMPSIGAAAGLLGCTPDDLEHLGSFTHVTTHRIIEFAVHRCARTDLDTDGRRLVDPEDLHTLGISNAQARIVGMLGSVDTIPR